MLVKLMLLKIILITFVTKTDTKRHSCENNVTIISGIYTLPD